MGRAASYDGSDGGLVDIIYSMLLEKGKKGVRYNEAKRAKVVSSQIKANKLFVIALMGLSASLSFKKVQLERCFSLAADKAAEEDKFVLKDADKKSWRTAQAKRTMCLSRDVAQAGRRKPPPRS